jgi:fatty-acyl-CoA synthase
MQPTILLENIKRYRAQYVWQPNFAFQHIIRRDNGRSQWDLSSIKAIVNCSEPCRTKTFENFIQRYEKFGLAPEAMQVSYALAENVFAVTHTPCGRVVRKGTGERTKGFLSCGAALRNTKITIRSSDGSILKDGEVGEVWLQSQCIFNGYFRQADLSSQKFSGGWFKTGDLGTIENDEVFIIGRLDDVLIVNGKNVMAHEIEDHLNEVHDLIPGRILVFSRLDDEIGTSNLVVMAESNGSTSNSLTIEADIRKIVHMVSGVYPNEIILLCHGSLIKSSSGKIARSASIKHLDGERGH